MTLQWLLRHDTATRFAVNPALHPVPNPIPSPYLAPNLILCLDLGLHLDPHPPDWHESPAVPTPYERPMSIFGRGSRTARGSRSL